MRGGKLTGSPMRATGGSYHRLAGAMTFAEIAKVGKLLFRELSTPALPPLSTGANGAIVATATPADASAAASSVVPAGDGRSPLGDSSDCGLHGTSVPINGAAMGTPRSLFVATVGAWPCPPRRALPRARLQLPPSRTMAAIRALLRPRTRARVSCQLPSSLRTCLRPRHVTTLSRPSPLRFTVRQPR